MDKTESEEKEKDKETEDVVQVGLDYNPYDGYTISSSDDSSDESDLTDTEDNIDSGIGGASTQELTLLDDEPTLLIHAEDEGEGDQGM